MLARWLEELSQFDMVILHRKGSNHTNANALSRIPDELSFCNCYRAGVRLEELPCGGCAFWQRTHSQWSHFEEEVDDVMPLSVRKVVVGNSHIQCVLGSSDPKFVRQIVSNSSGESDDLPSSTQDGPDEEDWFSTGYTPSQLREAQLKDSDIGVLLKWVEDDQTPFQAELQLTSAAVKFFWVNRALLQVVRGVLFYSWIGDVENRLLFIVPQDMRKEVLRLCHDLKTSGHPGMARTYYKLQQHVIWYGMKTDCTLYVKSCSVCNRQKKPNRRARGSLGSFHAGAPLERVHVDILGPIKTSSSGNKYVLMVICQFTKWIEAYALPDQMTATTVSALVNNFFARFGCPLQIHSDQGSNFTSDLFQAVCNLLEVTKTRTTPYRPCSNGQVERYNRTLLQIIRCYLDEDITEWDKDLDLITSAIRALPNRQTSITPKSDDDGTGSYTTHRPDLRNQHQHGEVN